MTGRHATTTTDDDPLRGTALTYADIVHEAHHTPRHLAAHDAQATVTTGYREDGGMSWDGNGS